MKFADRSQKTSGRTRVFSSNRQSSICNLQFAAASHLPTHQERVTSVAVNPARVECPIGKGTLILETGKFAKQAHGAVLVRLGDTVVLAAAVAGNPIPGRDFFPLQVEYRERTYAAGKFPGGFIKRETRPSTKETLTSRLIDRPSRPLFPVDYFNEVQIHVTVISSDKENDPDVLGLIGRGRHCTFPTSRS